MEGHARRQWTVCGIDVQFQLQFQLDLSLCWLRLRFVFRLFFWCIAPFVSSWSEIQVRRWRGYQKSYDSCNLGLAVSQT
jgi:hypothetical protein